jgi:hypothetical protein
MVNQAGNVTMISKLDHRPKTRQSGYVLITAMVIMSVLLATGLAFMRWSTEEAFQARQLSGGMQAYYLAQMGVVEKGFAKLRNTPASQLPWGFVPVVAYPGYQVPGLGAIEEVSFQRINQQGGGGIFGISTTYKIWAVGMVKVPSGHENLSEREIRRKAVLYVELRSFADYMYLTGEEMTSFGDRIKFMSGDTLCGRVHSNSQIAIMGSPVFYSVVSSTASDFWRGIGYAPIFNGPPPVFEAQQIEIPAEAQKLREGGGTVFISPGTGRSVRAVFNFGNVNLYTWDTGTPFDSTNSRVVPIGTETCIFVDAPLEIKGIVQGGVTIGSRYDIRLIDNIRYSDSNPANGITDSLSSNYLGIVSEGNIKVANTRENGREHSNGMGIPQPDQNQTSIVITAAVIALGESFTFENQNDPDSGYNFGSLDDRGTIYLYGSITQKRRGYVHRSTNVSTGYLKQYRYDKRFLRKRPPCLFDAVDQYGRGLFNVLQWGQAKETQADVNAGRVIRYN